MTLSEEVRAMLKAMGFRPASVMFPCSVDPDPTPTQPQRTLKPAPKTVDQLNTKVGSTKAGTQKARLVPCAKKPDTHGHHPADETCPYCEGPDRPWWWR